ncbi:RidA family protein [Sphingomonas sp.]|uniref:RidA family protein n=1 Tax=Sphingomonas sp. TaxID=28214 RepID=UPI001B2EACB4|nr:RidA family protein [Sphingomonas sp.]MBO9714604.1 RidA family protein [Sphingomonas sp.]
MADSLKPIACPDTAPPGGHYSAAMACGDLVFISGQLPILPDGSHTADRDFEAQAMIALDNFLAVAAAAGAGPEDVAKVTVYVVGIDNWPRFNRLYARRMGEHRPARAIVPVPELHYGYLIEIEGVAIRRR